MYKDFGCTVYVQKSSFPFIALYLNPSTGERLLISLEVSHSPLCLVYTAADEAETPLTALFSLPSGSILTVC